MPKVPTYDGPQLQTQALQPNYQNNVDVSSGNKAMGQAVAQVADSYDRILTRDAETAANKADTEIAAGWLQWDAENRKKYQGENADGYKKAAEEWWGNAAKTYGANLDDRAKVLVSQTLARRQAVSLGNVAQHVEAVKEQHADQLAAANVDTTIQFGVTSGDVAGAAAQVRKLAAEVGARKGWSTEQVQAEQGKHLSALHLAQISKLAETDPQKAQAYYDANKAEVGFGQQARVEEVLRKEVDNQFAVSFAAKMADKPLAEQLKAAGEITDPARREKTLIEVRNNYALVKQAKAEQEANFSDQAWQLVGQGKRVPEAVLAGMDGHGRVQLQEFLRARSERLAAGHGVKTDMATYIDLRERLAAGENINLRAYTEKIAPSQMEQLLDIKTSGSKGGPKQDSMLSDEARINAGLVSAGIDKKKDPESAGKFMGEVDRRVRALSAANGGKQVLPDEKQKIIDELTMDKVYVKGFWSDAQKPVSQLKPEQLDKAYVKVGDKDVKLSAIPLEDRLDITRALRSRGMPVSEQTIAAMYLRANPQKAAPAKPKPVSEAEAAATGKMPSPYASEEAWTAYRKWQAANKK